MDRIRKTNNKYQVLITTSYIEDLGILLDNQCMFDKISVQEYDNIIMAQNEALNYAPIDWEYLVLQHIENYKYFYNILKSICNDLECELYGKLLEAYQIKNKIFDRTINKCKRLFLTYDSNNIISFHIIVNWSQMGKYILDVLSKHSELNIIKIFVVKKVHYLICNTMIGTTYEIIIWPTYIYQWAKMKAKGKNFKLSNFVNMQDKIDMTLESN